MVVRKMLLFKIKMKPNESKEEDLLKQYINYSYEGVVCLDINECLLGTDHCEEGCRNIPGSYYCTCGKGYALSTDKHTCQSQLAVEKLNRIHMNCIYKPT